MNLRQLLKAARAAGWEHAIYGGSFGTEHRWILNDLRVSVEPWLNRDSTPCHRLTIVRDRQLLVQGFVDSVGQVVHLLAAYGLINCPDRERLHRVQDGYAQLNLIGAETAEASFQRLLDLHTNNGTPIGGA